MLALAAFLIATFCLAVFVIGVVDLLQELRLGRFLPRHFQRKQEPSATKSLS